MVAPAEENPVEVFTKLAPHSLTKLLAKIFSSLSNKEVSIITFTQLVASIIYLYIVMLMIPLD